MSLIADYEDRGIRCAIIKHDEMGHLCGYIGVQQDHPWFGKHYDDVHAEVHGGLTYEGSERHGSPENIVMQEDRLARVLKLEDAEALVAAQRRRLEREKSPEASQSEPYPCDTGDPRRWWLGFDCAHLFDVIPNLPSTWHEASYRDEGYVRGEISGLVTQVLAKAKETRLQQQDLDEETL